MKDLYGDTLRQLATAAERSPVAVVGFSGGKDSLVCLDLACRSFRRVAAYHMYFIPGLACVEVALDAARRRWGVDIVQYPHWELRRSLANGVYCFNGPATDDLPQWEMADIYALARRDTGAGVVVHGAKNSDSVWRRRTLAGVARPDLLHPLKRWGKRDVLAYLRVRGIPVPDAAKGNATGIGLGVSSLLWLADKHPADFHRLCQVFPLAEAVVWRERFYGRQP